MNGNSPLKGFRVHYFRDLSNAGTVDLRTLATTGQIISEIWTFCPACRENLKPLAVFVSAKGGVRLRLGCCSSCGYLGYMDRPSREFLVRYYTEEWDNAKLKDVRKEAERLRHALSREQFDAAHFAERFSLDKSRPVCDIGCGNGGILEEFRRMGFGNLVGVENSRFRAELARERYGCETLVGNFENPEILTELSKRAPIGLFFSFHVLEHVYDPREIIGAASALQKEGDYLILAMPDAEFEPAVITLFWLPHLHAYTRVTLEKILNSFGYEVAADNFSYKRLMMVGRKSARPAPRYEPRPNYREEAASRILNWFFLPSFLDGWRYRVSWTSKTYHTDFQPVSSYRAYDYLERKIARAAQFFASRLLGIFNNERSLVISRLQKRLTSTEEAPLEIQFDGDIEFLLR